MKLKVFRIVIRGILTSKGEAFIETKNLDGETNLKHKTIPKPVIKTFRGEGDIEVKNQSLHES